MTQEETQTLGYSRDGGVVTVRLAEDDFHGLMLAIGYAAGAASKEKNISMLHASLRLANALNAGRPASEYRPYDIRERDDD